MKTLTSVSVFVLTLLLFSCKKNSQEMLPSEAATDNIQMQGLPGLPVLPSGEGVAYCGEKVVPLCAGQNINVGYVKVLTGFDGKVYITYRTYGLWQIRRLHLYAGPANQIPVNGSGNPVPGSFPYKKNFTPPYLVQEYTFEIEGLPSSFVVAAHAEVVRLNALGNILQQETAWGDGCDGTPINPSGQWGTYFWYNTVNCATLPEICSFPVNYYFDSLVNGVPIPWIDCNGNGASNGAVTVALQNYSETEGRAIYNTPNPNGIEPLSKRAFANVATLKMSHTNYYQDVMLLEAVTLTETWLTTLGKLSPTNLPTTSNPLYVNAVNYISTWIVMFECPDRR